jgi:outer membrane lipase/esterase
MKKASLCCLAGAVLFAISLALPAWAAGGTNFSSIVVFGDSLSDPGNDFALIHRQNTPPYDDLDPGTIIPHAPYAKGGHHYSNGATWVEQFARQRGLAAYVGPAWQGAGTKAANYAVGGGRAHTEAGYVNLTQQVSQYLNDAGGQATTEALYVIEFGANDIRDILVGGDPNVIIPLAINSTKDNILYLYGAGARKFLVWNAPDLSLTPAIIALDRMMPGTQAAVLQLVQAYNAGLETLLAGLSGIPGIEIRRFDAAAMVRALVGHPEDYGLDVVNAACVTPLAPPFDCKEPDEYLFWDGIHPTKATHAAIAQDIAGLLSQ